MSSQVNAPELGCLLTDRANGFSFADNRLSREERPKSKVNDKQTNTTMTTIVASGSVYKQQRIESLRTKRRRRNKKKRQYYKKLSKQERKDVHAGLTLCNNHNATIIEGLKTDLHNLSGLYEKERKLSGHCWKRYKEEKEKKLKVYRFLL